MEECSRITAGVGSGSRGTISMTQLSGLFGSLDARDTFARCCPEARHSIM